jgi:hypothetical protein
MCSADSWSESKLSAVRQIEAIPSSALMSLNVRNKLSKFRTKITHEIILSKTQLCIKEIKLLYAENGILYSHRRENLKSYIL